MTKVVQPTEPMHLNLMNSTTLLVNISMRTVFIFALVWKGLISILGVTERGTKWKTTNTWRRQR